MCNIRIDDKRTRDARNKIHGLAPINEMYDLFLAKTRLTILHLQTARWMGSLITLRDASEQAKYGTKVVSCNDVQTGHMVGAQSYVGKGSGSMNNTPHHYVTTLSRTI